MDKQDDCPGCAALKAENERLKKQITKLEDEAKKKKSAHADRPRHSSPAEQQADIARRTLPKSKPHEIQAVLDEPAKDDPGRDDL
jgi:cell division protein FtsB